MDEIQQLKQRISDLESKSRTHSHDGYNTKSTWIDDSLGTPVLQMFEAVPTHSAKNGSILLLSDGTQRSIYVMVDNSWQRVTIAGTDVISGIIAAARLGSGTPGATVYLRGDGAWTALNGDHVTSGTIAVARMGSGTPSASTYLRGDGAWSTLPSGASAARAYMSTDQAVNSTTAEINFDTESYDVGAEFDTSGHRFTATSAGRYIIHASIDLDVPASGSAYLYIYKNNASVSKTRLGVTDYGSMNTGMAITDILSLAANDYIEFYLETSGNFNINGHATTNFSFMDIHRIA